jgi:hypothetical protein
MDYIDSGKAEFPRSNFFFEMVFFECYFFLGGSGASGESRVPRSAFPGEV